MNYVENARKLRPIIERAMQSIDGNDAIAAKNLYPVFEDLCEQGYKTEKAGYKFRYGEDLYETLQPEYTFVPHYVPGMGTESLFKRIDETHSGTREDPIPYEGNMALVSGLYYVQSGTVYECVRDTGIPVYSALSDLVGIYVEVA